VGPSTAFLIEAAPPNRRGLYVAVQFMTQDLAVLAAGIVGFVLSNWLSPASLDQWGWRLAFLIGTAVVAFGLYLRRTPPETLYAADRVIAWPKQRRAPRQLIVLGLLMMMARRHQTTVRGSSGLHRLMVSAPPPARGACTRRSFARSSQAESARACSLRV
jgi:MFS family permease